MCPATGSLARPSANLHNAWVKASPRGDPLWPDVQLLFVSSTLATDVVLGSSFYNFDAYVSLPLIDKLNVCSFYCVPQAAEERMFAGPLSQLSSRSLWL